jgi:hypothetical protein
MDNTKSHIAYIYKVESNNIRVSDSAIGNYFCSRQRIDVDKFMKRNNLLIRHKHGKEIALIER